MRNSSVKKHDSLKSGHASLWWSASYHSRYAWENTEKYVLIVPREKKQTNKQKTKKTKKQKVSMWKKYKPLVDST